VGDKRRGGKDGVGRWWVREREKGGGKAGLAGGEQEVVNYINHYLLNKEEWCLWHPLPY
jgi:hypothetical protein